MKKFFTLVAVAMMAVSANAQKLLAEFDWSTAEALPGFVQFADDAQGTAELTAEGLAINVNYLTENIWQPQLEVLTGFDLKLDGNYKVVVEAKYPADCNIQVQIGSWGVNTQTVFPITASGDFQTDEFEFPEFPDDAEGAHVIFQTGGLEGTYVLKSVKIYDLDGEGGEEPSGEEPGGEEPGGEEPAAGGDGVMAEFDWSTATELPGFVQFADDAQGTAELTAEGLAINVNYLTENIWQPQLEVLTGFDLKLDGNYKVVVEAKYPADCNIQVQIGSWGVNTQTVFPITATGDFQVDEFEFPEFPDDAEGAHVIFQTGGLEGTYVLKSVKIIDLDATSGIQAVKAEKKFDGAIYNLAGQKVNAAYKGVVIKDGKKYLQK